ncbi:MAG: hypothetical protein U1D30_14520 [Planctomycetota bacterium]
MNNRHGAALTIRSPRLHNSLVEWTSTARRAVDTKANSRKTSNVRADRVAAHECEEPKGSFTAATSVA